MSVVKRAVWFIEGRLAESLTLDAIASASGVSRFALSHLFAATTGMTTLGYVRVRRLSEAAKRLSQGAPDILELAFASGYGSHEAFSRAFRDAFGVTPSKFRETRALSALHLTEAYDMSKSAPASLPWPTFETLPALRLAGIAERMTLAERSRIPGVWARYVPNLPLPGQKGRASYGASLDYDAGAEAMTYLCAVEVDGADVDGREFTAVQLPAQRYAVFRHDGHVSAVGTTFSAIFENWAPHCGLTFADKPACLERYGAGFDGRTGEGGFDILVPIAD